MGWNRSSTAGLVMGATSFVGIATAQTLPPLLTNLSTTPGDEYVERALVDRISTTFPRDISSGTLGKLLDLDGFDVESDAEAVSATLTEYKFPCITSYIVTWTVSEAGQVDDLQAAVDQNCV